MKREGSGQSEEGVKGTDGRQVEEGGEVTVRMEEVG
jgi:hypothetical protein